MLAKEEHRTCFHPVRVTQNGRRSKRRTSRIGRVKVTCACTCGALYEIFFDGRGRTERLRVQVTRDCPGVAAVLLNFDRRLEPEIVRRIVTGEAGVCER